MADIPEDVVTLQDLKDWYLVKDELSKLKQQEALMRSRIFKFYFKDPKEGTNDHEVGDGTGAVIKGGYVINRKIDPGALDALREAQRVPDSNAPKINIDELVKYNPELAISKYRELTAEEQLWFDQALIIKPGAPTLEVVIPKRAKAT